MDHSAMLHEIERSYVDAVRAKTDLIRSGPFLVSLNPINKLRWLNNAVIDDDSRSIEPEDIRSMIRVFEEHDRIPRMEIFRELRLDLLEKLIAEGFEIENELPAMFCTAESFRPYENSIVQVESLGPASDLRTFLRVGDIAFANTGEVTPERIERLRQTMRNGNYWAAIGRIDGQVASVASLIIAGHTAELAGVGTQPAFRRKGGALAVSSHLMREFFEHGNLVWLSAGDDTAKAVYEHLGFRVVGTQVNISRPE
jgi:ribosomal protein S18 acetylase RimI-like enzyme